MEQTEVIRRNDDPYFVGSLDVGKREALLYDSDLYVHEPTADKPYWAVLSDNYWGSGHTEEEAWRFYLGAVLESNQVEQS